MSQFENIFEAAGKGTVEDVRFFVEKQGVSVQAKNNDGNTPLHWAIGNSRVEIAKFLVSQGADVNAKNNDGCTPLFFAKNVDVANILVSQGADVNAKKHDGFTPLHFASHAGRVEVAKCLVAAGADVNAKLKNGSDFTPLDFAQAKENTAMVQYLQSVGGR